MMKKKAVRPVIIAGKIYVCGADGFRAAATSGIAGMAGALLQPHGYYVRTSDGVRLHDGDGEPFVFIKREHNSGFIVTCSASPEGIRYMYGASDIDLAKLGLEATAPEVGRLERELAERLLWETSPELPHTVYELLQRAFAAEADFEVALDRVYGAKREPETRYQKHTDETLKAAAASYASASEAWRSASRFSQDPSKVRAALASPVVAPSTADPTTQYLVACWTSVDTASFVAHGPRDELAMALARLADDIDARETGPAMYEPIPLLDTNGLMVGEAVFTTTPPEAPADGNPLLVVPVASIDCLAIAVADVSTKLRSSIEDVRLVSHADGPTLAHFYWGDLPALERQWHAEAGVTWESLQGQHSLVWEQMEVQDRTNPSGRFVRAYEGIERAAESLGLQACLQGVGDCVRVGYFKDGQWTGIASEITLNGKVLTTVNGRRAEGTGYTADGEWQRDQLESALARLPRAFEAKPAPDVYADAADLYEHGGP